MPKISKLTAATAVGANDLLAIVQNGVTKKVTASILQTAPEGVSGPGTNNDGYIPQWNGADSNTLKNGLSLVTTVGVTGLDTAIVSEQGVRESIANFTTAPATNTDGNIPQWDGGDSKTLKNGLSLVTTVGATGSDTAVVSEQGVREAIAAIGLNNLSDVTLATPAVDQILKYNGTAWINESAAIGGVGPGITFYLDDTDIIAAGAGPETIPLKTLQKSPSDEVETIDTAVVNATGTAEDLIDAYLYDSALGGSQIDGGIWSFHLYSKVSNTTGTTQIKIGAYKVVSGSGTVTITGAGTSRTATVSGATPFVAGDANATPSLASYLQTPAGVFQISAFTSDSVVTITTLSTYSNESGVAYSLHNRLFTAAGVDINRTAVGTDIIESTQQAFAVNSTDKFALRFFANTTASTDITVSLYHSGTSNNTHIVSPLVTRHNEVAGLQGGQANEYYHLTSAEYTAIGTHAVTPATNTDGNIPQWNGANSRTLKDGLSLVTTVGATGLDTALVSEQGVREALNEKAPKLISNVIRASSGTLTGEQVSGTILNNYGQVGANTQTLPAAAIGYNGMVVIGTAGAGAFNLKAGANDKIYLDGTALDDGDKASLATPAIGDYFTFWTFQTGATAYDWIVATGKGTLTDGGA